MESLYQKRPAGAREEARAGRSLPSPSAPIQAKPAGTVDPGALERAERLGHDFSKIRIGSGRRRADGGRTLPSHHPGCGCPSCAGRTSQGAAPSPPAPAADTGSGKAIQLCRICGNPSCTDESRHVPSVDSIMEDLDPEAELRHAMELSDARYRQQASTSLPGPHLFGSTEVRGVERRMAEVREPVDRLLLSAEPRLGPRDAHYTQLRQSAGPTSEPITVGRFQDPTSRNAAPRERHIYEEGTRGAPSYPREASHLSALPNPFAALESAMLGESFAETVPEEASQRHVMTTANILGIAEQRRDPFMALSSAQTIVHAARSDEPPTPSEVFGRRQGRVNQPGLLSASGTGAVAAFRGFRSDLEEEAEPSTTPSERLRENISEQHTGLMEMSIQPENLERMASEGLSEDFIREATVARARSAATRLPARMTGQLRYNLRSLLPPASEPEDVEEDGP